MIGSLARHHDEADASRACEVPGCRRGVCSANSGETFAFDLHLKE